MADDGYPFNDTARALEQMGWLKAQIDNCATKEDMARLEADIKDFIRAHDDERDKKMLVSLDRAFEQGIPGTQRLVENTVKDIRQEERVEFAEKLKKAGLVENADGTISPKIHPIRRLAVKNSSYVLFGAGVAAAANPDLAFDAFRWAMQAVF